MAETAALTVLGTLAAVVLLVLTRDLLAWWPAIPVLLTAGTIAQTAAAGAAIALLATWLGVRRGHRGQVRHGRPA